MKSFNRYLLLGALLAWPAALTVSAAAQTGQIGIIENEKGDQGYWTTTSYVDPPKQLSPTRAAIRERMMKRRVVEEYIEFLSPLRWPHRLRLFASDCYGGRGDSPHYMPGRYFINMCYAYAEQIEKEADMLLQFQEKKKLWTPVSRENLIAGMYVAALLHETGHAAFDILDAPVFGREEDGADQVEAFIALQFGREVARTVIKADAYEYFLHSDPPISKPNVRDPNYPKDPAAQCWWDPFCAYSDEHGTSSQRMYNLTCMAYGGHPEWVKDFVESRWLPPERAKNCPAEYQRAKTAFQKTILPFIDAKKMEEVIKRSWFQGAELKER
jgi:hypothetical protein